jgi:hypothetical protein
MGLCVNAIAKENWTKAKQGIVHKIFMKAFSPNRI